MKGTLFTTMLIRDHLILLQETYENLDCVPKERGENKETGVVPLLRPGLQLQSHDDTCVHVKKAAVGPIMRRTRPVWNKGQWGGWNWL